jgi:hypothetical protein
MGEKKDMQRQKLEKDTKVIRYVYCIDVLGLLVAESQGR